MSPQREDHGILSLVIAFLMACAVGLAALATHGHWLAFGGLGTLWLFLVGMTLIDYGKGAL